MELFTKQHEGGPELEMIQQKVNSLKIEAARIGILPTSQAPRGRGGKPRGGRGRGFAGGWRGRDWRLSLGCLISRELLGLLAGHRAGDRGLARQLAGLLWALLL